MDFTDLLTIAMPCYERKEYFLEALESALNQTVKCKVIVVDNCSSHDYFEKICDEKNIAYYRNDRNIGIAANFARSFELADTKYVMNLQDDDVLSPEYVEAFLNAINQHPDIDVFFTNFVRLTSNGELPHKHTLPFGYMENGNKIIEYGIKYKLGFPYMSSVIKRTKAHSVSETLDWLGCYDWEWIYSKADKFSFYGEPRNLYSFRIHDNQATHKESSVFRLTIPYIYDKVLIDKVSDPNLKRKASKNAFWELIKLKADGSKCEIKEFINGKNKYDKYIKTKLDENFLLRIIYVIPKWLVRLVFKVSVRIRLYGK